MLSFFIHAGSRSCAAVFIDSGSVLQIVSEMSWDTLLLLVGLAFVAVAVVGNISGKITPGKEGRIAAAVIGIISIGGGIWYHNVLHTFKITGLDITTPDAQTDKCPITIPLQAIVDASGTGDVIYNFQFSTGNASALQHVVYNQSGSQILTGTWQVRDSIPDAWVQLNIAAPVKRVSNPSQHFSVTCETASASTAQPSSTPAAQASSDTPPSTSTPPAQASSASSAPTPPASQPAQQPPSSGPGAPPAAAAASPAAFKYPMKMAARLLNEFANGVTIESVKPAPGLYLKRGTPVPFDITVTYNLTSADTALLSISTAQARSSSEGCAGNGELTDAVEVPIQRGRHVATVHVTWSGDTGLSTKGRVYGSGYVSFVPMFWANQGGQRGARIASFSVDPQYCYRFGP